MSTPTMKGMEEVLAKFKKSICDGVPGVMRIDGPRRGPVLGITACTHGNEPAGLAIFQSLLTDVNVRETLRCGTLYLIVNNIKAAEKFFACKTEEEWPGCRFVKIDMNRLPKNVLTSVDQSYEVLRTCELHPIWKRFTHGLDIHSTTMPTKPMIISRGRNFNRISRLVRGFPIKVLISNIDNIQRGVPPFAFYGESGSDVPVFGIEAGQHTNPHTLRRARSCALALLQNLGMLTGTPKVRIREYQEYEIVSSIMFQDKSFDFVKDFGTFDEINKGDLLARGLNGKEMKATRSGHLIMPTDKRKEKKNIVNEVSFISLPVRIRRVK